MIIGLDFDNTIICYDRVFSAVALENNVIPKDVKITKTKESIKSYLISMGNETLWTELQGYVYGKAILEAVPYPGSVNCIEQLIKAGNEVHIISHKTRTPFLGPKYDLHAAAKKWIKTNLKDSQGSDLFSDDFVHFNETILEKLAKVKKIRCRIFLDDLLQVLNHSKFPKATIKSYFAPNLTQLMSENGLKQVHSWQEFRTFCDSLQNDRC